MREERRERERGSEGNGVGERRYVEGERKE